MCLLSSVRLFFWLFRCLFFAIIFFPLFFFLIHAPSFFVALFYSEFSSRVLSPHLSHPVLPPLSFASPLPSPSGPVFVLHSSIFSLLSLLLCLNPFPFLIIVLSSFSSPCFFAIFLPPIIFFSFLSLLLYPFPFSLSLYSPPLFSLCSFPVLFSHFALIIFLSLCPLSLSLISPHSVFLCRHFSRFYSSLFFYLSLSLFSSISSSSIFLYILTPCSLYSLPLLPPLSLFPSPFRPLFFNTLSILLLCPLPSLPLALSISLFLSPFSSIFKFSPFSPYVHSPPFPSLSLSCSSIFYSILS